jgi:hypothetical protein
LDDFGVRFIGKNRDKKTRLKRGGFRRVLSNQT